MFWLFGHPEVYILILPAMGIVSEILPTFSRKPLFGYPFVVFSGIAIGFMSWGVWVHHMYTTGLGTIANSAFGISTILIGVPTGVKMLQLDGDDVGRLAQPESADDVRDRVRRDVHDRRAERRHALDGAVRLPAAGHVLRRRALPLRAVRRLDLRAVRGHLLLVAEVHGQAAERYASARCTSG